MIYKQYTLDVCVEQMKALAERLIPFNPPKGPPSNEAEIGILKSMDMTVDGYEVCVYFTKSDFGEFTTEVCQIWGHYAPFLPFSVVCKIAKSFLGNAELSLVEIFKDNRKVYCWTVNLDVDGKPVPNPYEVEVEECTFEGFRYNYLQPNQVNFY